MNLESPMRPKAPLLALALGLSIGLASTTGAQAQRSAEPSPLVETCIFDGENFSPTDEISIRGRVLDASHDVPVPGARVDATWIDSDGNQREEEAWTNHDGFFRFCRIEDGLQVGLSPEVGGGPGPTARTAAGLSVPLTLIVPLPEPEAASGLFGTLREADSGRSVERASVRIPVLGLETESIENGTFIFEDVEPGSYRIEIEHASYGMLEDEVHLVAGRPLDITFSLDPEPIAIQGVEATARPRSWMATRGDITRRLQTNMGNYLSRDDFLRYNEPPLSQMLATVPGFRAEFVTRPGGRRVYFPEVGSCGIPAVYVDGAALNIRPDIGMGIDLEDTANIELIEFYRGTATLPAQYRGLGSQCGLMLIWTRRAF